MSKIGVIGLGKLGLCLALNLEKAGFDVVGYDIDNERLTSISDKKLETSEPLVEALLQKSQRLNVYNNLAAVLDKSVDLIFVIVPTPSQADGSFSHKYIDQVIADLVRFAPFSEKKTLVINSTTMPGYCGSIAAKLEPINIDLIYNPEFIAQGSIIRDQLNPDQVLIGTTTEGAAEKVQDVYERMCENNPTFCVMDLKSAEIAKLATNCFLTMKISFANNLGDLAQKTGADAHKILQCIGSDSRIGSKYLNYGFGFGGPCFPRDNQALMHFGTENNHPLHLSESTVKINGEHFQFQLDQLLAENRNLYIFDNVAYKAGTDIIEESQQLKLAVALAKAGKKVRVSASLSLQRTIFEEYGAIFEFES